MQMYQEDHLKFLFTSIIMSWQILIQNPRSKCDIQFFQILLGINLPCHLKQLKICTKCKNNFENDIGYKAIKDSDL